KNTTTMIKQIAYCLLLTSPLAALAAADTHTVARGETLYSIATRHHTSVDQILRHNSLRSATIHPAQKLSTPGSGGDSGGAAAAAPPRPCATAPSCAAICRCPARPCRSPAAAPRPAPRPPWPPPLPTRSAGARPSPPSPAATEFPSPPSPATTTSPPAPPSTP